MFFIGRHHYPSQIEDETTIDSRQRICCRDEPVTTGRGVVTTAGFSIRLMMGDGLGCQRGQEWRTGLIRVGWIPN